MTLSLVVCVFAEPLMLLFVDVGETEIIRECDRHLVGRSDWLGVGGHCGSDLFQKSTRRFNMINERNGRGRVYKIISITAVVSIFLAVCGGAAQADAASTGSAALAAPAAVNADAAGTVSGAYLSADDLTLEQKVGQLFILRPDTLDDEKTAAQSSGQSVKGTTAISDTLRANIKKYHVGGFCQFSQNIVSPEQITQFNKDLQAASDIPLFLAVDEEGGRVARLANTETFHLPKYESAAAVGAQGIAAAYTMGNTIGAYVRSYGFSIDFAPDADVNTNPNNPIIGTRAFSSNGVEAAALATAAGKGIADAGVIPTFKHFPGHGDTAQDSHTGMAFSYRTLEQIQTCELLPFAAASTVTPHAVMVSHISMPNITGDNTPATLSKQIVSLIPDADRTLIITDAMEMSAISSVYSSGEAAVGAILAGCDVVLMPADFEEAYNAVLTACQNGTISAARLDQSVTKVLQFKRIITG